jgi:hypothetical protein
MAQDEIQVRLERVRERIALAAQRAGRHPHSVTLLGAAKQVEPERILRAIRLGLHHLGENRVQEAESKFERRPAIRSSATWHLIGHLQTNKVRRALELFDVIQSLDSIRLAEALDQMAAKLNRRIPIYIEVNVGEEPTKFGVPPNQLGSLAEVVSRAEHLRLEGLMAVPPYCEDPEAARPYFRKLRTLLENLHRQQLFDYDVWGLSMGMSNDYEVAIEEGATVVRLGTAIWGPRPQTWVVR